MGQICIICAIRQETQPILKRFPAKAVSGCTDFPAWRFQASGQSVILLESGIGVSNAAEAASQAAALGPDIIISAGFCGALSPESCVGEVLLADKLYSCSSGSITAELTPDQKFATLLGTGFKRGNFITTDEIVAKAHIYSLLPDPAALNILEMESSAVAQACRTSGIRFSAIRSVSDSAEQDPSRLFQQICDNKFRISMARVAMSLLQKPSLLPEYIQLYRNTAIAGKSLSEAIEIALERI